MLFYLLMPMVLMAIIIQVALLTKKRKLKNRHLKQYQDVAPETTVYHEQHRKKKK